MAFDEATREKVRLRMAIQGPSGSGKTATGLLTAYGLTKHYHGRIAVIDTQHRQSLDYVKTRFAPDGFKVEHLETGNPDVMLATLKKASTMTDVSVLFIDSLSICWAGEQGLLEKQVDMGGEWRDWGPIGKIQNKLFGAILKLPFHVIVTIQSKTQWITLEEDHPNKPGKKRMVPHRVGTDPVQRKGFEYWWPLYVTMDEDHAMTVQRINAFEALDKAVIDKPDHTWVDMLIPWLEDGRAEVAGQFQFSRKASDTQVAKWEQYAGLLLGKSVNECVVEFVKLYGMKPSDCEQGFLEERLTSMEDKLKQMKRLPLTAPSDPTQVVQKGGERPEPKSDSTVK